MGRSTDPESRIRTHQQTAFLYGAFEGGRSWFARCDANLEVEALTALRSASEPIGREFFDLDFDRVVEIVRSVLT